MSSSSLHIFGLIVVGAGLAPSCSGGERIDVGGACVLNSDCNQGLVCTWGKCHDGCHTTADCPAGQSCITASDQSKVCQLPIETQCIYDSDCQPPLKCAADQRCRNQCQADVDCPSGQTCTTTKSCAEPNQVDSNNNLVVPDGGVRGSGGASGADAAASCPTGAEGCSCYASNTCNTGLTCASHLCVSLGTGGASGTGGMSDAGGRDGGSDLGVGGADAPSERSADLPGPETRAGVSIDLPAIKQPDAGADASSVTSDGAATLGPAPDVGPDRPTDTGQVGCLIELTSYPSGAANPANACQTCQPALSGSTWTNVTNGTACGSGQVCSVGICRLGCWLDGSYYPAAASKPGNACQNCNPTLSVSVWTNEYDGTGCGSGQVCKAGLCGTGCWLSGIFYASGAINPANACQSCQPGTSDTAWTNSADGASCGAGQVCSSTSCQSGCWIDGILYGSGAAKSGNPCQTCQPSVSVTGWTNAASATGCPVGQVCSAGACQAGCLIGGSYYAASGANPSNACQACKPEVAVAGWTDLANGTTCATGQVCSGASCQAGCWIDLGFRTAGAAKSDNACQSCQPGVSTAAWTNVSNGTGCGSGQVCKDGICGAGCWISGSFYTSGAANPLNACQTCQPGNSDTAWTDSVDGAGCGTGQVCSSVTCQSGCWISGSFYSSGAAKAGNPCQTCQPSASVTDWTNIVSTTACTAGKVCSAGACQAGCWVGGAYSAPDAVNPSNACQTCQPGVAVALWTDLADGTGCGTGHYCSAVSCQAGCWIDSTFRPTAATKPDNACQSCQPGVSSTDWTNVGDGTDCGNQQGCSAGVCGSGCWIASVFYTSGTVNPGNACQSCQPGTSTNAWTNKTDGTGCGSGQVCSLGVCGDCVPGRTRCRDASTRQICQESRTWVDDIPACTYGCYATTGACYPQCAPAGPLGCATSTQPKQCDATGTWQTLPACSAGKECVGAGSCLKSNGQSCTNASECASGACTTFYIDADGDGYAGSSATFCGISPPPGYVSSSLGTDCCDSDANAHPGQGEYFTTTRIGCGGYDYDCVNGEEKQYACGFVGSACSGIGSLPCWWSSAPSCGGTGSLVVNCTCSAGCHFIYATPDPHTQGCH